MANLYSVLPGLQPTQQEIVEAELLAKQILEAQFPDLDLREGTGLRDLVLRPNAFLLALVKKGLDNYFAQNTIDGVNDSTPQDVVDALLSNWFLTRNLGTYAVVNARLYFARQKNISLSSNVYFSPDNSLLFYPQQSVTIPASSMTYDAYQNEWYVDIDLKAAQQGTEYNLSSGSLLYFSTFDPYFLHGEINYLTSASVSGETNSQFITRAQTAISTRNLINNPSIVSNLQQEFNFLSRVVPIGMGDAEMVRDQIKAVFDPETPRLLAALSSSGTTATATLPNHGWETGQVINVTGASPTTYNGQVSITVVDPSTFTYTLGEPASIVTVLPTVQSVTAPVFLHNGGMIDIYCDDSRANSVIQLTTDSTGRTTLSGPIYAFSRSSISGGGSDDTIPFQNNVNYSSTTVDTTNKVVHVSATAHGLSSGQIVTTAGLSQTLSISSISCSGVTVTVVSPNHGLSTGTMAEVSGVTPSQYNGNFSMTVVDANTLTYAVPANIPTVGSGTMTLTNLSLVGSFSITVLGPDAFDVSMPTLWTNGTASGTITISYDVPYTVINPNLRTQDITSMTCEGTTVTVTISQHGLTANRYVTIAGATPSAYNGQWLLDELLNDNQFTFTVPTTIAQEASGANMICTSILPWSDLGFSTRQNYIIDFGPGYANQTASFEISYFSYLDSVQPYLEASTNRVLAGDPLARGFNFYELDFGIVGYGKLVPSSGTIQTVAQTYLQGLAPGQPFIMSDFVAALEAAGVTSIQTPPSVKFTKYTRDLISPISGTIVDYLDPNDRTNVFLLGSVTTSSAQL